MDLKGLALSSFGALEVSECAFGCCECSFVICICMNVCFMQEHVT